MSAGNPGKNKSIYDKRRAALAAALGKRGIDALCVSSGVNVRYLTGFKCSFGRLLCVGRESILMTDSRYTADANASASCTEVVETLASAIDADIRELLRERGAGTLAFEQDAVTHGEYLAMRKALRGVRMSPVSGVVEGLRLIKDDGEIEAVRRACALGDKAFKHILGVIKPGVTEKQIAASLDSYMAGLGIDGLAFESIVASGRRGAYPHAKPSGAKIRRGELVTMDFGVCLAGYNSDMTRTVAVGEPEAELKRMYLAVRDAQAAACDKARAGVAAAMLDATARKVLVKHDLSRYFTHGLGHGVGLEVHEAPRVSSVSDAKILKNMIFTIEPGVYVEGVGGVRIEDTVAATKTGIDILTRSPKKLIVL